LREALIEMAADPELDRVGDGIVSRVEKFLAGAPRSDDITLVLARRA